MKKHILICLMGLLCLPISTLKAQSKVAESPPGTDLVYQPGLPAGNRIADFSVSDLKVGFPGQEGASSSARLEILGFFTLKSIIKPAASNTQALRYTISTRELDPYYQIAEVSEDSIALSEGSFYAGTSGKQVFEIRIPLTQKYSRFSLFDRDTPLMESIWVQPGDSLLVNWDQRKNTFYFSGPAAPWLSLQNELKEIASREKLLSNPVMILSDEQVMINTPAKLEAYQEASQAYLSGWSNRIEWLTTEELRMERATELFERVESSELFATLDAKQHTLDQMSYAWLRSYWKGKLQKEALEFVRACRPTDDKWANLILSYTEDPALVHPVINEYPYEVAESIYLENMLLESLLPVSFPYLAEVLPIGLKDQVMGLYLIRQYKELVDADSLINYSIVNSQTPWIAQRLDALYQSNLIGRPFSDFPFAGPTGKVVTPSHWKGKLVLIDFWLSGCGACLSFANTVFIPLMEEFKNNEFLQFVTVSGGKEGDQWIKSLDSGRYTTDQSMNLFSGGAEHPTLKQNHIRSFPAQVLLDPDGNILKTGGFPKELDSWISLINSYLEEHPLAQNQEAQPVTYSILKD
ncbi:thiol-disulfide isomerase/thioredoxin [Algoriphagus ratkowskyi]|uniref:Thiol-disulfide isomerase/thioredoxin n=1 Tax=Algoriphagus ratkowskyi TaxID=57028 RepID=A0A2W7QN91_9BACT|nr:hypothetical protein [Algoriphagus ratkowskyi]PZX49958.1 thiol-disulfide isomerase/thioredoxin [Algoriphagus ratkowskyi]TXD75527.1 hypothetical protein ESW18_20155 [Algoriphagus ratkowskyi]